MLSISQQKYILGGGGCIYPFYSWVVTPVSPITTVHLSLTRRDIKVVPLKSHSRMPPPPPKKKPTSHLYLHTHTHIAEPLSPFCILNRLISLLIWDLWVFEFIEGADTDQDTFLCGSWIKSFCQLDQGVCWHFVNQLCVAFSGPTCYQISNLVHERKKLCKVKKKKIEDIVLWFPWLL